MLTVLTVLWAMSCFLPELPIWITDNGNKYIVMRNFAETGSVAIQHPAPEFFPTGGFHFVRHRGAIRSFYPEYYPVAASWWWKLTGDGGLKWLSMLGTAVAAGLISLCMRRHRLAPMLLAFATPMLFFSFLLWEMTWSVCAMLAVWMLVQKKRYAIAGAVLGASLLLREEAYFFAFALTVALACRRDFRGAVKFLTGMAMTVLPIWMYQYREFGHVFGLHGGNYYANNRANADLSLLRELGGALWNYYHHLLRFDAFHGTHSQLNFWCLLPAAVAVVLGVFTARKMDRLKVEIGALAVSGWLVLVWGFLCRNTGSEAFSAAFVTGAIGSNPLFLPFYLNWRRAWRSRSRAVRDAAVTICVYLLIVPPFMTRNDIGLIYGARHFLCIIPLMLFLSAHFFRRSFLPMCLNSATTGAESNTSLTVKERWHRILPLAVGPLAIALQFGAFTALVNVAREFAELERLIDALPEKTVVSDAFFLPEQTPHLFFTKDVLQFSDTTALLKRLRHDGRREFILLLSAAPRFRRISNEQLSILLNAAEPTAPTMRFRRTPGSGFMDLHIVRCRLK
jgi:hypothetical protein